MTISTKTLQLFAKDSVFTTIFDAFPCPIFIKDDNVRFVFINKAYENFFGVTNNEILGKTVLELEYLIAKDRMEYHAEDLEVVANVVSRHHEFDYTAFDKKVHHCLYWSCGFYNEDQNMRGLIGFIIDISRREKAEKDLFKKVQELSDAYFKLEDMSVTDHLTGLKNRRGFTERIMGLITNKKKNSPFCLVMFDIDFFKKVNDNFGHDSGDKVLKEFASLLNKVFRQKDYIFRWGGEEFIVLLGEVELSNAFNVAERLRVQMKGLDILNNGHQITVSGGLAQYIDGEAVEVLLKRLDEALYAAKATGRDRIVISGAE